MADNITGYLNTFILIVLSISTLFSILDLVGFLPKGVKKHLKMSHASDTLEVLNELGIDVDKYKRSNYSLNYPKELSADAVKAEVEQSLKKFVINKPITVGKQRSVEVKTYIDLIGATCNPEHAAFFANMMCSYLAEAVKDNTKITNPNFDYIVTPKAGSPLLGYEFSKLLNKPLILHEDRPRFRDNDNDVRRVFDCLEVPPAGSRFLIVDDSITAGGMLSEIVKDIEKYNYQVSDCFVIFELVNKGGREKLKNENVNLLSIVEINA